VTATAQNLTGLRGYMLQASYRPEGAGTLGLFRAEFEAMGRGLFLESVMGPVAARVVADTLHAIKRLAETGALWTDHR